MRKNGGKEGLQVVELLNYLAMENHVSTVRGAGLNVSISACIISMCVDIGVCVRETESERDRERESIRSLCGCYLPCFIILQLHIKLTCGLFHLSLFLISLMICSALSLSLFYIPVLFVNLLVHPPSLSPRLPLTVWLFLPHKQRLHNLSP